MYTEAQYPRSSPVCVFNLTIYRKQSCLALTPCMIDRKLTGQVHGICIAALPENSLQP